MQLKNTAVIFLVLEAIWLLVVGYGIYTHHGLPHGPLPLKAYDKIVRGYGSVLPFIPVLLRYLSQFIPWYFAPKKSSNKSKTDPEEALKLYCLIFIARWVVYGVHLALIHSIQQQEPEKEKVQLISDHIVLGASMVVIFQTEITILLSFKSMKDKLVMEALVVLSMVLFALTCGDMYYTAYYFHPPTECVRALVIGATFQAGALYWLVK